MFKITCKFFGERSVRCRRKPLMDQIGVPSIKGRTPEQDKADNASLVQRARQPYDATQIMQIGWKLVDKQRLKLALKMRNEIPILRTALRVTGEAIKQSGLIVRIGKSSSTKYKTDDLFGKTILNWGVQMAEDQETFGFGVAMGAPAQPEIASLFSKSQDTFGDLEKQLFALPVCNLDIYHRQNVLGEHQWVVCEPPDIMDPFMRSGSPLKPIPGCFVFWRNPPDENGNPQSTVLSLMSDYFWLEEMKACALGAARKRSNPVLVTERVVVQKDPQLHGIIPLPGDDCDETKVEQITMREKLMDRALSIERSMGNWERAELNKYSAALGSIVSQLQAESSFGDRLDLPAERKLVRQVAAESPGMELQKLQIHFEQKVLMAFGIPPGMIQPESTHGKMVSNENAMEIMNAHLGANKQSIATAIQVMLRKLYQEKVAARYALQYKPSLVQLIQNTQITVELPSIPPEAKIQMFYEKGWLKYDALVGILSTLHLIPAEHFETTPKLSQMDLLTSGKPAKEPTAKGQPRKRKTPS